MVLIFLLYALFASTFTLAKEAVSYAPPVFFIGVRMTLAGALLLAFVRYYKKSNCVIAPKDYFWFSIIILFHIYCSYVFEFIAMQHLTSGKACLIYNLMPFVTAFFSYIFFKEVMTPKKWLGLSIGLIGSVPLLMAHTDTQEYSWGAVGRISLPEMYMLIAVFAAAIGWIAMKKLTKSGEYSYFFVNAVGMAGGGILALCSSAAFETWPSAAQLCTFPFLRTLFLMILIGNIICYNLYGKLLEIYSATVLSFFGFFTPAFGALFGWLWLGESVSISFFITLAFVAFGLFLFYQEELKQGYILHK